MDDVHKACERFERLGVDFVKKPNDGKLLYCFLFGVDCTPLMLEC